MNFETVAITRKDEFLSIPKASRCAADEQAGAAEGPSLTPVRRTNDIIAKVRTPSSSWIRGMMPLRKKVV